MLWGLVEYRSGSVRILEREVFNDAGKVVRGFVISDWLDHVCADLHGVARFILDHACVCFADKLAVYLQVDFSVGIPFCLEADRTGDRVGGPMRG